MTEMEDKVKNGDCSYLQYIFEWYKKIGKDENLKNNFLNTISKPLVNIPPDASNELKHVIVCVEKLVQIGARPNFLVYFNLAFNFSSSNSIFALIGLDCNLKNLPRLDLELIRKENHLSNFVKNANITLTLRTSKTWYYRLRNFL